MAGFVINGVVFGNEWDEDQAIDAYAYKLNLDTLEGVDLDIRPATVREVLADVYGEDWATEDYRRNILSHVVDVFWNEEGYKAIAPSQIIINNTMGYDVHGYADVADIANYRELRERWSDCEALTDGPYSGSRHIGLELDKEAPADLIEVLEALEDYLVLDDQLYSEVEQETMLDHWELYGRDDVYDAVAKAIGADHRSDLTDYAEELIDTLVWEGILDYGCGGGYPTMIDSSMCDFGTEAVAEWIKARLGLVVFIKPHNGYGNGRDVFLNRNNLVSA
ncbi:hypothetical protein X816_gp10 [Mycobacterium phage Jovo]|uniref:Uncharacterized protein n=1 Tax=Mycobacterium phage Jovo TaxID=1429912 RepID=V5R9H2_9CAUD|nr:hypothetical protein X816_gp10 [Mycobacterium phage Jovo]AHB31946.1 hypothetical protein JOVO_81 [Mycobacterium phage Jovo]